MWRWYIDNSLEVVKQDKRDELAKHLNSIDTTVSIKCMDEPETEWSIPFLDVLITQMEDGKVKVQLFQKATHTDKYLNFSFHHPLNLKQGVIHTLYDS